MSKSRKKEPTLYTQIITNNEEISPDVHVISFKRDFDFMPGQVVKIGIDTDHPPRIYSICSGNHEEEVQILFNIKEDGFLTPKMGAMIPGDKLLVSKPYGSFIGVNEPAWWIATGTGIAPFYSMFRSGMEENKKLIHGVAALNQFYFEDELEWALGSNYVRCCSRETSCDVFPGRVTAYLSEINELPNVKFYLCGKPLMVVEVRDLLIEKGVPYENILAEIYF
ncbi:FAD-dependent oxidoreductase [uncultured Draconibacterium sp.]|uniref:ferredoxin--NADP reductase n=1 Tax=uncultured Draconibacterium sp. TaxID=1573823 RepID=UPI0032163E59